MHQPQRQRRPAVAAPRGLRARPAGGGVVKPSRLFVAAGEGWGAWEWVGRYGVAEVGDAAFPSFADAAAAARRAGAWTSGGTGFLASTLKLVVNDPQARFDRGPVAGAAWGGAKARPGRQVSF